MAGQSPTVLRVAAKRGDAWNTHGPFGAAVDAILEITRTQNARLDELCEAAGRDPAAPRRSLPGFGPLDPWTSPVAPRAGAARGVAGTFEDLVERFVAAGVSEFVLCWPPADRLEAFEHIALEVIARLRAR